MSKTIRDDLILQKINHYPSPRYPDRERALSDPAILLSVPQRWKRSAAACAAMTATAAMLLSACRPASGDSGEPIVPSAGVAPLFEHGGGHGGYGCVSVAPPAFLSEEEAYAVILETAAAEGLSFTVRDYELANVRVPKTSLDYGGENSDPVKGSRKQTLTLDGYDPERAVGFEFVSSADVSLWSVEDSRSSVTSYDFIDTADALREGMAPAAQGRTLAVFYDPNYDYSDEKVKAVIQGADDYRAMEEQLKELIKEDLREQVRDFIAWLKAEEII